MSSDFNLKYTSNFIKHYKCKKKILISQGGGRSSKTYSILQLLIIRALKEQEITISIVGENMPFIKRGALADFKKIIQGSGLVNIISYNATDHFFTFPNGSEIQFFSVENYGRALGAARDYLFINEANNIQFETAFQLMARTNKRIFLDFNPVSEFWAHREIMNSPKFKGKWDFIKTNFYGNEELDESIKEMMLARAAKDENYKRVYVDGDIGHQEGIIFKHHQLIDYIPQEIKDRAKKQYIGLDFGWSPDPTSLNEIYILGSSEKPVSDIYINELMYKNKQSNLKIADIIKDKRENNYLCIADYAEPKSIEEIKSYGVNIIGATSKDINYGLYLISNANVYITKDSINTINEFRNYKWATDRHDNPIKDSKNRPVPIDLWNHSIDNIRYVALFIDSLKYQFKKQPPRRSTNLKPI